MGVQDLNNQASTSELNESPHFKLQNVTFQNATFLLYKFLKSFVYCIPDFLIVNQIGKLHQTSYIIGPQRCIKSGQSRTP